MMVIPKACRDPAPSAAIVEFLLYDTQRLELEECAVRSDTACSRSFSGRIACCSKIHNEFCGKTCLSLHEPRIFGAKAPCRTIIRNALNAKHISGWHFLAFCMHIWDIVLALFIFTKHHKMIRSPIVK